MLTIFAKTEDIPQVEKIIQQEDRLHELITIQEGGMGSSHPELYLKIAEGIIKVPLPWNYVTPPYLFPEDIPLTDTYLLGLIFHFLENDKKSWEYLNGTPLYQEVEKVNKLKFGISFSPENTHPVTFREFHNEAVIHHYGLFSPPNGKISAESLYEQALSLTEDHELAAFSSRELATRYLDQNLPFKAEPILIRALSRPLSPVSEHALKLVLIKIWMQKLVVPYQHDQVEKIKKTLWEVLTFLETQEDSIQAAMLLMDAAHIANISKSYSESLGYLKQAVAIFEEEGLTEMAGSAYLKKGTLLYTWAQDGNPQFYKAAVESYQLALKAFPKEDRPDVFADIHHKLAVVYAEMPADPKRKGIWAGVSSASFQEALSYYTKENFPYEYGSICNNFGNALTKFPSAVHSDNHEKAIYFYQEALSVRNRAYPYERAISLLNFLEASWRVGNAPETFNEARYLDMVEKAWEVKKLVKDKALLVEAETHLDNLYRLKQLVTKESANA
ncbi:MAG: hypothetical protein AAF824_08575 [Bacteroidota bacterium]